MRAWRLIFPLICLATWGALVSIQLGWVAWARHAWAFDLWQYLPTWASPLLGAAALGLCLARVRRTLLAGGTRLARLLSSRAAAVPPWLGWSLVWVLLAVLLWTVREQQLLGDSRILIAQASRGVRFTFPDVGVTFLLGAVASAARSLELLQDGVVDALRLAVCASGALGVLFVWRAGHHLAIGRAGSVALLILSGGFLRIFAGHLEVYAFVLAAAGGFLWSSLAFLAGRVGWAAPCATLGVAVWLHPSAVALVPSLVFLLRSSSGARPWRRVLLGLALTSLPWLLFLPVVLLASQTGELEQVRQVSLELLGLGDHPDAVQRWVRPWGGGPGAGTHYVLLGLPHLKYLVNAAHLLCAWAVPVLVLAAAPSPRRLLSTPTARFLCVASLPLVVYALVLRPVWGPFDWDLFALTALFLAALSAHLLATVLSETTFRHVALWLGGSNLLFVGLPLLLIGFAPVREAGPFVEGRFDFEMIDPDSPALAEIAPWL
jgi:hypothetical protein